MAVDLHRLASLMVRDATIIAKRHAELARDYRAIAGTWRQVLDDTQPPVLYEHSTREDGMPGAPPMGSESQVDMFVDLKGDTVL